LIPAGTGLAYHEARRQKALGLQEVPNAAVAAAEELFAPVVNDVALDAVAEEASAVTEVAPNAEAAAE
jgi:phage gp46-like protein